MRLRSGEHGRSGRRTISEENDMPMQVSTAAPARALAGIALCACAAVALGQPYPRKPIRLFAPFPPGGGTDILSRLLAVPLAQSFGQPVIVDNRPGAGGAVGAETAARAEPDGHTLTLVSASYCATAAYQKTPYDPVDGIQPIILLGTTGLLMTVHPSVPAANVKELLGHARANPGRLNYASVGIGSVGHLGAELFKQMAKVDLVHVPYKGGGPALSAVIAGESQLTVVSAVPTLAHLRAGRLKPLGITTQRRSPLLPEVATIAETVPGYEVTHWYGIWGPKGLRPAIVERWNKEVAKVMTGEEMRKQMQGEGLELAAGPPEQLHQYIRKDVEKWRKVIRDGNIGREG
jgi:tripartite-type tricarboxylate transporter receptor subunit TctC